MQKCANNASSQARVFFGKPWLGGTPSKFHIPHGGNLCYNFDTQQVFSFENLKLLFLMI